MHSFFFSHSPEIWQRHPELAPGVLLAQGIHRSACVQAQVAHYHGVARARLEAVGSEADLPEIQAWRRSFARMGLKPTQYRCASESLLRRFRKEGALPPIHPLVDLCNALSLAFAIPIAVFDLSKVAEGLQVRCADGSESYLAFSGETETPERGEVVFADAAGCAHARRWTHRQSALSAVRDETSRVLIVAEALHADAANDVQQLLDALSRALAETWAPPAASALLRQDAPRLVF
ncbi:phenylalanine--tRNA ligase beta subunit-related protein [Variovorax paradoxus]|jgi:DNA/RNA-binding domain of Phe-tRNA-synthetase-like protein|uniref:B3/B4 domain-containing protein n=1 Tax=Variovorax paradoxus TaxID=34073 RepID=UPI00035ECC07|nr:phenylalanine--tRNA ligase beta subunit-related protein [Variovorax paradoxus]